MKRKKFIKKGIVGFGSILAIPTVITACNDRDNFDPEACIESPIETAGPFVIKSPSDYVRENIIGDRTGIALMMVFTVQNINSDCNPIENAIVDVWHCDAKGNYSQYDGQFDGNLTGENFLRGRQTTDLNGNASFISIFPGWYPGRTPHIHIEIKSPSGTSLLITQVSWPDEISNTVYASNGYMGEADTNNSNDGIVSNANLADSLTGDTTNGYVLTKRIKVDA